MSTYTSSFSLPHADAHKQSRLQLEVVIKHFALWHLTPPPPSPRWRVILFLSSRNTSACMSFPRCVCASPLIIKYLKATHQLEILMPVLQGWLPQQVTRTLPMPHRGSGKHMLTSSTAWLSAIGMRYFDWKKHYFTLFAYPLKYFCICLSSFTSPFHIDIQLCKIKYNTWLN